MEAVAALLLLLLAGAASDTQATAEGGPERLAELFGGGVSGQTAGHEYQLVYVRRAAPDARDREAASSGAAGGDERLSYSFSAFGRDVWLQLRPNRHLVSPHFRAVRRSDGWVHEVPGSPPDCHYLHRGGGVVAAVSLCDPDDMNGFVVLDNTTLEIRPLTAQLRSLLKVEPSESEQLHVVRRAPPLDVPMFGDSVHFPENALVENSPIWFAKRRKRKASSPRLTVEAAVFLDEAGYKLFSPFFGGDDRQLRDMLLAYMNGVQALYHHPSVGQPVDITLVRMELMRTQPSDLPHHGGERGPLLDSFCDYSARHNPAGDSDPRHWDMALYVSGLDFFAYEGGRKSGVTMGLATVGGVCMDKYACVIAELGTTNVFGKPYPSAGFTSVYILAHEMGHNLGMHHDGSQNSCPKDGFIMSPSRGTSGETQWSSCSADVMKKLSWATCLDDAAAPPPADMDQSRFLDEPGQLWGAKRQCELLLRDKDAVLLYPDKLQDICENLKCKTPHRSGYYFAGPALEGTSCGSGLWCRGGECVVMKKKKPAQVVKGGWSDWKPGKCSSGCIIKSRGFQARKRTCDNPKPVNTEEGCEGPSFDVVLCKDDKICKKGKRRSAIDYATKACAEFSKLLPDLDSEPSGLQAPHEEGRLWMACSVFCRRKGSGSFYTPRLDLNDLGVDPYFPDGTWCHRDAAGNHYCQQHHCLPENYRLGKSARPEDDGGDVPLPQNAPPRPAPPGDELLRYLSLGADGRPLLTTLTPGSTRAPAEHEWTDHDYREVPPQPFLVDY
ncbi:A disintegrin and metalloproteinase with thrombospondin motifs adt-1-like [Bacillus rossius redtenbacheri]|uniref:A disintegrin and metalloproteinase with thrombospondin motifs adt-1-like n=1 Tax=Bacillus rossius redtenbacheri TaxID=93214 RepID=UPI002FDE2F65